MYGNGLSDRDSGLTLNDFARGFVKDAAYEGTALNWAKLLDVRDGLNLRWLVVNQPASEKVLVGFQV